MSQQELSMRPQFAKTVREHFPAFSYCYNYSEDGRVKYWLSSGVDNRTAADAKQFRKMKTELAKLGIVDVYLASASFGSWGTNLVLVKGNVPKRAR
jgi:hypothetical protein